MFKVNNFKEKPQGDDSWINGGYFVLEPEIFEYIEIFYNRQRIHSSNNYMSPNEYEEKMLRLEMVG